MIHKSILILIFFSFNLLAQPGLTVLNNDLDKIVNDKFFERSQIAIEIYDLTEGKSLYSHNNKLLLHPASNMKLLTSAAGLVFLGPEYEFTTTLYYDGVAEGTTFLGDLYIVGGLDPDLTSNDLDSLVQAVKSMGIRYITRNIYADISIKDSLYWGNGWMWDESPDPNAPLLSALNINDNGIEVFVTGNKVGLPGIVSLKPETKYVTIENRSVTVPSNVPNDLNITRDWLNNKNAIIIEGTVRNGEIIDSSEHTEKLNLVDPEKYFLTLFKEHLGKEKISTFGELDKKTLPEGSVYLAEINRSLVTVLTNLNKESDNLNAEMILYALALKDSTAPALAKNGIEIIKSLLDSLGLDPNDYSLADGSGVSRYNLVSAELLIELLKYMYKHSQFYPYYNSLSIAGVDGTLEERMMNTLAEGNVHAKTGTLAGVSSLSGYVSAKNGNLISFTIMMQNYVEKNSVARTFQDKICELLANYH
ncbi:MAG: D-alanyl-D-alanine carboxypeptidase/D-alanyl-D-alanine-endopeptidase [Ignavibacteriaceae bacterium]|jgi:D-alanyl-D-alanine carboxypeptidase/D-alanyl-D-alanine-endopeptidase (penicillin-binding protein 4)